MEKHYVGRNVTSRQQLTNGAIRGLLDSLVETRINIRSGVPLELLDHERRLQQELNGKADRQVFSHPVDREAEIELAGQHRLVAVLHLPALCCPFRNHVDDGRSVETGALRKG